MLKVTFFQNGNTMAFRDGQQVPDLQESWFLLYIQFLASHGIDPLEIEFAMPHGVRAMVFKTNAGYNWQLAREDAGR